MDGFLLENGTDLYLLEDGSGWYLDEIQVPDFPFGEPARRLERLRLTV